MIHRWAIALFYHFPGDFEPVALAGTAAPAELEFLMVQYDTRILACQSCSLAGFTKRTVLS